MSIHDLKSYKESKSILPDLERMILLLTLIERGLVTFSHYIPIAKVLFAVKDQKAILEGYKKNMTDVQKKKGERPNT